MSAAKKSKKQKPTEFHVSDAFWKKVQPLIPVLPSKKKPGRPRMDDRKAFNAIYYVLRTGIQWNALPKDLGAASTVHDRFSFWNKSGLFYNLWQASLVDYELLVGIDWQFQSLDGCHVQAPLAGEDTGASYKHRGKSGTNRSTCTDGQGIPLAITLAPANIPDMKLIKATLDSFVLHRPDPDAFVQHLCLDKGYDALEVDCLLYLYKYIAHIRRKGIDYSHSSLFVKKHKPRRWVVERTHSWLNSFRRLILRWERKVTHYFSFLALACSYIIWRKTDLI